MEGEEAGQPEVEGRVPKQDEEEGVTAAQALLTLGWVPTAEAAAGSGGGVTDAATGAAASAAGAAAGAGGQAGQFKHQSHQAQQQTQLRLAQAHMQTQTVSEAAQLAQPQQCEYCGEVETSKWRRFNQAVGARGMRLLCNACGAQVLRARANGDDEDAALSRPRKRGRVN